MTRLIMSAPFVAQCSSVGNDSDHPGHDRRYLPARAALKINPIEFKNGVEPHEE